MNSDLINAESIMIDLSKVLSRLSAFSEGDQSQELIEAIDAVVQSRRLFRRVIDKIEGLT